MDVLSEFLIKTYDDGVKVKNGWAMTSTEEALHCDQRERVPDQQATRVLPPAAQDNTLRKGVQGQGDTARPGSQRALLCQQKL